MTLQRRNFILGAAGSATLVLLPVSALPASLKPEVQDALAAILKDRTPLEGGISIDAPRIAENGAQVPVTIRVDSPMTAEDHVTTLHILATDNPAPGIGTFHLTPHLARAEVFTRIRLAEEQDYIILAELSDGRVLQVVARTAVSVGGCAT
ncbi:MAG: thiosulfate oxidation carrier protein SoxY [Roseinatronobacter sp.]